MSTAISWTDETWNPVLGCTRVSSGCDNCYAISSAHVRAGNPHPAIQEAFAGLTERRDGRIDWTGRINTLPDRLDQPLHWKKPRRIFVNSMSDLFHDSVPDEFIAQVWTAMAATPQHTYQILTKRHARMRSVVRRIAWRTPTTEERRHGINGSQAYVQPNEQLNDHLGPPRVLPNVWLGVSAEDQKRADLRIPALLETPAVVRWISAEPLLGPIGLRKDWVGADVFMPDCRGVDWVVVGGESGRDARPMHPGWARSLRDQCTGAGIPFHFKQWGEWGPAPFVVRVPLGEDGRWHGTDAELEEAKRDAEARGATHVHTGNWIDQDGERHYWLHEMDHKPWSLERADLPPGPEAPIRKWGVKAAGRELDGRTWDEYPQAVTA